VNEPTSDEHGIACDEFHCIIADEKAWKYGNNRQGSYKGHLDPPFNLIQEKTYSERLSPLAFLLLNNVCWQGPTVMDW
jgi:hypothetical protein